MAKRVVSIQEALENEEDFEAYLEAHKDELICLEVYSEVFGQCQATSNAVRKGKLEVGGDKVAMAKAAADNIPALERFKNKSEPIFIFIRNHLLTRVMFGANGIELIRILEEEINNLHLPVIPKPKPPPEEEEGDKKGKKKGKEKKEGEEIKEGEEEKKEEKVMEVEEIVDGVLGYDLSEVTPYELEKIEENERVAKEAAEAIERVKVLTAAARKRRVCLRLSELVKRMNFILFWPHNHQAHYDLYEKWDMININVASKETIQLDEDMAREALYMSDVDLNEASLHALIDGEALVVQFKMFETDDRDFVQLLRYALYEEIPEPKEDTPPEKQLPPIPAYQRYASISKTAREVRRARYNAKMQKLREEEEENARLKAEQERLARQAEEDRLFELQKKKEEERMARIQAGLPPEPEDEPPPPEEAKGEEEESGVEGEEGEAVEKEVGAEALPEGEQAEGEGLGEGEEEEGEHVEGEAEAAAPQVEEFDSDVEVEDEDYIPPGGLLVPGLYCPPNELAKANGLRLFFPKSVISYTGVPLESEHFPPHVLVIFPVEKRNEIMEVANQYPDEILNIGFFLGDDPATMSHVAFTLKQYNKMNRPRKHLDRLAIQVSRQRSLPLLQMACFNPVYISSDREVGEKECLVVFPVGYGDEYVEEESIVEEEVVEIVETKVEEVLEEAPPEEVEEEEEELEI